MMKNVIVTGANGFIGSTLVKKLVEHNVHVVAIDLTFEGGRIPDSDNIVKPIYHSDTPSDTTKPLKINKLRFKVTQGSDTSERDSEYWLQIW